MNASPAWGLLDVSPSHTHTLSLTRLCQLSKGLSSEIFWAFLTEHPAISDSSSIDAFWKKLMIPFFRSVMPPLVSSSLSESSNSLLTVSSSSSVSPSELTCSFEARAFCLLSAACFLAILVPLANLDNICAAEEEEDGFREEEVVDFLTGKEEDTELERLVNHVDILDEVLFFLERPLSSDSESLSSLSFVASVSSALSSDALLFLRFLRSLLLFLSP